MLEDFEINIPDDYITFTTDSAANMIKSVIDHLDKRLIKCFAHLLNTILKKTFFNSKLLLI